MSHRTVRTWPDGIRIVDVDYDPELGAEKTRLVIVPKSILPPVYHGAAYFLERLPYVGNLFERPQNNGAGRFFAFAPIVTHNTRRFFVVAQRTGYDV